MSASPPPACSVIVPSYCAEGTIAACLDSLRRQDAPFPFEVIVVDSSPDGTPALVRSRYPEARLLQQPQRTDPAMARNLGAASARGPVLAFLDSDCIASPGWLRGLLAALDKRYDAAGGSILNGLPGSLVAWAGYFCEFREFLPKGPPRRVGNLTLGNAAYRSEAFQAAGGFPNGCFPQEDQVFHHFFTAQGFRIWFDPRIRVSHAHRAALPDFLAHQGRIGRANARVVRRLGLPGAALARRPALARALLPALVSWRLARTLLACWQVEDALLLRRPALAALCARGMLAWGRGFVEGAAQSASEESELSQEAAGAGPRR